VQFHLHGADDHVAALRRVFGRASAGAEAPAPASYSGLVDDGLPTFIEFAPMSGATVESLPELERQWFAPARDALSTGRLEGLRLVANDQLFEVAPRSGWKFWRRRRTWLESLA
jgi:hypothetical protein